MSNKEAAAFIKEYPDTRGIDLLAPDISGILRGKRIGMADLETAFEPGINYPNSTVLLDVRGNIVESVVFGHVDGDPDGWAPIVPGTLKPVTWLKHPIGQALIRPKGLDGQPFFADPRTALASALKPLTDMGLTPVAATELEFYLIEEGDGATPRLKLGCVPGTSLPQTGMQFGTFDELHELEDFIADIDNACRAQGIPASSALSEYSPGQFEINLKHCDDIERACDYGVLLKRVIKGVAVNHGFAASFMAKPFGEITGCGLHIHVSLLDKSGKNIFSPTSKQSELAFSDKLKHAVGGLKETMHEGMAIFAPNANSYRRFAPGFFAPVSPAWGVNHRGVSLRVPFSNKENARIEHRTAGADANPYLVAAAILAGIHHGLSNRCDPGRMIKAGEKFEPKVELPVRWDYALNAFEKARVLPQYLGNEFCDVFAKCKRDESERYHAQVTNRDYEWYLKLI